MNRTWKISLLVLILIGCASCDISTKWFATQHLRNGPVIQVVPDVIELRYTENDAIAFSMLKSIALPTRTIIIYTTSTIAFIILSIITYQSRNESFLWLGSLMLILAGAIGNLLDRLMNGYVVDFIHLRYGNDFSWPIFNIADVTITVGALILAVLMFRKSSEKEVKIPGSVD